MRSGEEGSERREEGLREGEKYLRGERALSVTPFFFLFLFWVFPYLSPKSFIFQNLPSNHHIFLTTPSKKNLGITYLNFDGYIFYDLLWFFQNFLSFLCSIFCVSLEIDPSHRDRSISVPAESAAETATLNHTLYLSPLASHKTVMPLLWMRRRLCNDVPPAMSCPRPCSGTVYVMRYAGTVMHIIYFNFVRICENCKIFCVTIYFNFVKIVRHYDNFLFHPLYYVQCLVRVYLLFVGLTVH